MLRRVWKPVAASLTIAGSASYYYYHHSSEQNPATFQLPVRTRDAQGNVQTQMRTLPLMSMNEVEERLGKTGTVDEAVERVYQDANAKNYAVRWRYTTASLASNDPIEDAHSNQIIQSGNRGEGGKGDLLFFSVFDGHGGRHTSQLLSKTLINAVALQLSQLASSTSPNSTSSLWSLPPKLWPSSTPTKWDVPSISLAIQTAFTEFDKVLLDAPLAILQHAIQTQGLDTKGKDVPDLSANKQGVQTMQAAMSGACALLTLFDTAQRDLYVACTGDSRAVAGISSSSKNGDATPTWKVDVLSEDQTARNQKEVERIQSEHPPSESSSVVRNGRVLGGLEPSRAFGDARYKWDRGVLELLNQVYMAGSGTSVRGRPKGFETPPYVTARPVVTHRKLSFDNGSEEKMKFMVIATDGLWDVLTPTEVVSLVAGHLAGLKGRIPKSELPGLVPTSVANAGVDGKAGKGLHGSTSSSSSASTSTSTSTSEPPKGTWSFLDTNLSTHLIRNALGGGDDLAVRRMMSIPSKDGVSRRWRDDITVSVVLWEGVDVDDVGVVKSGSGGGGGVRAKL